jgi:hypothetical protein
MNSENEIDNLISRLKIRNRAAREEASRQLQLYGEAVIPKLGQLLMESSGVVAEAAALILSKIGTPAIPILVKALREGGHGRRKYASLALAEIGISAMPVLEEAAIDEDRGVRWRAFNALSRIGAPSIPFIVTKLLENDEDTILLILESSRWDLTRADTPNLEQWDTEGNSVIPCLIQLLGNANRDVQFFGMGMLQKIGVPAISYLAKYISNCKNVMAEKNCVATLNGMMFGGVKGPELAGSAIKEYTSALFEKYAHLKIPKVDIASEEYEQAIKSGDSKARVWRERLDKEYRLLFGALGILAVPVLAPAWLNGSRKEKAIADRAMDLSFNFDSYSFPHMLSNPMDYRGPTSPDDTIFSNFNPNSIDDVDKIVTALEYKYDKIICEDLNKKETERMDFRKRSETIDLVRERTIKTIRRKGVTMLPCIIEMAQNSDDARCLCALEALSIVDGIDNDVLYNNLGLLPTLIRFMKIPHDWYRRRAMVSASHIGKPLLPLLSQYVSNNHDELDKLAGIALIGSIRKSHPFLEPFISDDNKVIRAFSRWYLA